MFDLTPHGESPAAPPTLVVVRAAAAAEGVEIFCVERSTKSRFIGGAIVFPVHPGGFIRTTPPSARRNTKKPAQMSSSRGRRRRGGWQPRKERLSK